MVGYSCIFLILPCRPARFRYWITHDDPGYNKLMGDVQSFIAAPGERDVAVSTVFTAAMAGELVELMTKEGWVGVEETAKLFQSDFGKRPIIGSFLKDKGQLARQCIGYILIHLIARSRTTAQPKDRRSARRFRHGH